MGSFNISCAVSHITIHYGDRAFLFPLLPNIGIYNIHRGHPDDGSLVIKPSSQYLYPDEHYIPFCFPIEGKYDDYGSLDDIVENENTKAIEDFLKIPIHDLVALVTDNRGKNPYDTYSAFYNVFFDKKEYMEPDVEFDDFLIGMGFEQNGMQYALPGARYKIEKTDEGYALHTDHELERPIRKALMSLHLNDSYNAKENLLKIHLLIEKEYLGLKNKHAFEIVRKLSGMFVHADIYDFLAEKKSAPKDCRLDMRISKYFLKQLGFMQTGEKSFTNGHMMVEYDGHSAILGSSRKRMEAYDCNEFVDAYKAITGEELIIPESFDYEEVECKFEDMVENFKRTKRTLLDMVLHARQLGEPVAITLTESNLESGQWKKSIEGLEMFKDMKYFFPLYEEMIENKSLKEFYTRHIRFVKNMYHVNAMFFPTFQGVQCGDCDAEKALTMKTLEILNKRIYEED